jgi:hypothetical protein
MNSRNFFSELKRRNVYKVAIAYAVVAWLLIQAGSILFPAFEAPGWVMKAFVTVVTAGFPAAQGGAGGCAGKTASVRERAIKSLELNNNPLGKRY